MSKEGKQIFGADAGATAALMQIASMQMHLAKKGVLSNDELNGINAVARSLCEGNGRPEAGTLIVNMNPSSKDVDPVEWAKSQGYDIKRP